MYLKPYQKYTQHQLQYISLIKRMSSTLSAICVSKDVHRNDK